MIIVHMLSRFKSFLLSIITLFRRALCCFTRRRKPSYAECEILTSVNVVQTNQNARSREEVCTNRTSENHKMLKPTEQIPFPYFL